jgi:hypothetical protein
VVAMQDPLHKTISKLTTDAGNGFAGASQNMSAEATLDAASASTASGGMRRPFIARGMSDPMGELPVLNAKYITDCSELHLSNKEIRKLAHFERFVNLNVLWLNNNMLKKIVNLDNQIRMFELMVFNNQITTLEGSLRNMRFLTKLLLHNNKLKDLDVQVEYLARLPFLEELTLFGNSIAEERNYRLKVICKCPSVKVLDRHAVTEAERFEANVLFAESSTSENVQPPSNLCSQQADAFRNNIAFGYKKPGLGRGPDNPASAAASIHLTLEVGRPWQSPMWNPAPWRPIYDPEGMSENEKDLIARVQRIHRDEQRLEKQAKLVERETIWMEKMDAQHQLARSALARARSYAGDTADEAVDMAMQRVGDLELTMQQLQRYMDGWKGDCTIRKDPIGGYGVHVDGGEKRPAEDDGVVIDVEGAALAAGLLKCVRVVSVNGVACAGKSEIDKLILEAEPVGIATLGLVAVKPKESKAKWSQTSTGAEKKLMGYLPEGAEEGTEVQVWPLPEKIDYEAKRTAGAAPWERQPILPEDGGEGDNNRLRMSVFGDRFAKPTDAAAEEGEEGAGEEEGVESGLAIDNASAEELYDQAQALLVPGGWDEIAEQGGGWKERAAAAAAKMDGADREEAFRLARLALRADTGGSPTEQEEEEEDGAGAETEAEVSMDATASTRRGAPSYLPDSAGFRSTTQLRRTLVM